MITLEQARKLKNGQHIKVLNEGEWIDALVVKFEEPYGVYAHHMGLNTITSKKLSIYGTANYFNLYKIDVPTKPSDDVQSEQGVTYEKQS